MPHERAPAVGVVVTYAEVRAGQQFIHDATIVRVYVDRTSTVAHRVSSTVDLRIRVARGVYGRELARVPFSDVVRDRHWTWKECPP